MNGLLSALLIPALLAIALQCLARLAARAQPLHKTSPAPENIPRTTLLKPLKGCDEHTEECLRSWVAEARSVGARVLFGVRAMDDPVCEVVRRLIDEHPDVDAKLVHCPESRGVNPKVSTLLQLEPLIDGGNVVISDADTRAPQGYLTEVAARLADPQTGLVTSFYRVPEPETTAGWIEAVAINCDFWSQVCLANRLRPMNFALGAAMSLRLDTLREVGGFEQIKDHLADDNQLGRIVARTGRRIELTRAVLDHLSPASTFRDVWSRQLRWARTIRVCEPVSWFFSLLANPLPWSLALAAGAVGSGQLVWMAIAGLELALYAGVRAFTAAANHRQLTAGPVPWMKLSRVLDLRDALGTAVWIASFLGNTVRWRGETLRVRRDGRLERERS